MFTVMSCAINYDSLVFFLSSFIIWQVLVFYLRRSFKQVLNIGMSLPIALLTKPSMYPFVVFVLVAFIVIISQKGLTRANVIGLREAFTRYPVRIFCALTLLSVFTYVSIRNVKSYGSSVSLTCSEIFSYSDCMKRNKNMKIYEDLKIQNRGKPRLSIITYYDNWIDEILRRTFGIFSHKTMALNDYELGLLKLLLVFGLLGMPFALGTFEKRYLFFCFLGYFLVVLLYANYRGYLMHGRLFSGVHGRYLLPVLGCFAILVTECVFQISLRLRLGKIPLIGLIAVFGYLDFPAFLRDKNYGQFIKEERRELKGDRSGEVRMEGGLIHVDEINGDQVRNASSGFYILGSGSISIEGWAFDIRRGERFGSIGYTFDGIKYYEGTYGLTRTDVAKAYDNDSIRNVGFEIVLQGEDFIRDTVEFTLFGLTKDGQRYAEDRKITLQPRK